MQLNQIAKDLAQKAVVSRTLGGVIKAGEYAEWASEYKAIADEHYASLDMEKKAISPLLANTLLGGGLGALGGGLGGYFTSSKKRKLKDALTYGLLGGLGGAGLGATGTLLADPNAGKDFFGDTTPNKIDKIEEMRDAINARGLGAATLKGNLIGAAGLGGGGALLGHKLDKHFGRAGETLQQRLIDKLDPTNRHVVADAGKSMAPKPHAIPGTEGVYEAIPGGKVSVPEDYVVTPAKARQVIHGFRSPGPGILERFNREIRPAQPEVRGVRNKIIETHGPAGVREITAPVHGPLGFREIMTEVENHGPAGFTTTLKSPNIFRNLARRGLERVPNALPKALGGLGVLASLASNIGGTADSTKARIINENVSKLLRSPEVTKNPQLMGLLSNIQKETGTSWKNWVPGLGGISKQRANEILDTLANNFSE